MLNLQFLNKSYKYLFFFLYFFKIHKSTFLPFNTQVDDIRQLTNATNKLYVSLYRYDYVFGVSIGIDCKVMKKLWHGLGRGRMVHWDDGIYYGLSSLIVRQQIKEPVFNDFRCNGHLVG